MSGKKGRIFVISAPSGCGKTTIGKRVIRKTKGLFPSISATTRPRRRGEKNKKDYHYLTREQFEREVKKGNFLEWENNFGHLYGTPKKFVLKSLKEGKNLLLSIDVKGAVRIKKQFPGSILIFIKPPSIKELSKRLRLRKTEKPGEITRRIRIAKKELSFSPKYDYSVVNDRLDKALRKVISLVKKEIKKSNIF